jgi:hypothetical protein
MSFILYSFDHLDKKGEGILCEEGTYFLLNLFGALIFVSHRQGYVFLLFIFLLRLVTL